MVAEGGAEQGGEVGGLRPKWLADLVQGLKEKPVANPPASVTRYRYKGRTVFYVPPRAGDVPSVLYDEDGRVVGRPDGGYMGVGDGKLLDFFDERTDEEVVWQDDRKPA
jgi:Domain of unknown function (DUF6970)